MRHYISCEEWERKPTHGVVGRGRARVVLHRSGELLEAEAPVGRITDATDRSGTASDCGIHVAPYVRPGEVLAACAIVAAPGCGAHSGTIVLFAELFSFPESQIGPSSDTMRKTVPARVVLDMGAAVAVARSL